MVETMSWGVAEQGWRKGPWTPEEDKLLSEYVSLQGEGRWSSVARSAGLNRSGKSCRLRWVNYLRPGLKKEHITPQEEGIIIELHALWGNKWSTIARYLPGRTDNEIKNYWRTHFKKKGKPSEKLEKRKFQGPKNYQEEENKRAKVSESPQSDVTSNQKMFESPQYEQELLLSAHPSMAENHCFLMNCNDAASWSDTIPMDNLWGWLWNLDDQNQTSACSKMPFQDQANVYSIGSDKVDVYNKGYIF